MARAAPEATVTIGPQDARPADDFHEHVQEDAGMSNLDLGPIAEAALHLAIATDMLQEMVCHLGANDGQLDEEEYNRAFYIALKVMQDAKSLRELVERAQGDAGPYVAKLRTAATDTALVDHVLATFRLADASPRDDAPGGRASVLKVALDSWFAARREGDAV